MMGTMAYLDASLAVMYEEALAKDIALFPHVEKPSEFAWPFTDWVESTFSVMEVPDEEPTDPRVLAALLEALNEQM